MSGLWQAVGGGAGSPSEVNLERLTILVLLALNALTMALYGWDKWCALRGWRRVPELWLLVPCALGGAPGAWVGCQVFRHKTRKRSFRWKLLLATLLNAVWIWAALQLT